MYNPKDILTEDGYEHYLAHLHNIREGLFYVMNHSDDLHIGAMGEGKEDAILDMYYTFEEILPILKTGDGEKDE
jgi:hypothetical protein